MKDWTYEGVPWWKSKTVLAVVLMGVFESCFLYVQFAKTVQAEDAEGLSLFAFLLLLFTSIGWLVWGALARDAALLITAMFNTLGSLMVSVAIYRYGGEANHDFKPCEAPSSSGVDAVAVPGHKGHGSSAHF